MKQLGYGPEAVQQISQSILDCKFSSDLLNF